MKKITTTFILLLYFAYNTAGYAQNNDRLATPEGIGEHLTEMLINRCDIEKSPNLLDFKTLLTEKDYSTLKNNGASFRLDSFEKNRKDFSPSWKHLVLDADRLGIKKDATYLKTFFTQTDTDMFFICPVILLNNKCYVFSATVLIYQKELYVSTIFEKILIYQNLKELEEAMDDTDSFFAAFEPDDKNMPDNDRNIAYEYNQNCVASVAKKTYIAKVSSLTEAISSFVLKNNELGLQDYLMTDKEIELMFATGYRKRKNKWTDNPDQEILSILEKFRNEQEESRRKLATEIGKMNDTFIIPPFSYLLNIPLVSNESYCALIKFRVVSSDKPKEFNCIAGMFDGKWKIIDLYTPDNRDQDAVLEESE